MAIAQVKTKFDYVNRKPYIQDTFVHSFTYAHTFHLNSLSITEPKFLHGRYYALFYYSHTHTRIYIIHI